MKPLVYTLCAAALVATSPATAKWTTMPETVPVAVAKSEMTVVAGPGWNQNSTRPFPKGETWSIDGPLLNTIDFYAGIGAGESLAKERDKKRKPLPKFAVDMLPTDIAQLYEQTARIMLGTSEFSVDSIEPTTFLNRPGFKFSYHYTTPDEELTRNGEAQGVVTDKKLYLIAFNAAALYYFKTGLPSAHLVMASASLK
ncbi:hypothetical protein [Sphingomonas sp.]|uniref:hypothetical protein n=1 Tax=Sphingomonas sp. TaxID=28214 RepID=UPI0025E1F5E3|nr:hypothetical protein [Sphingomonas sp.]